MTPEQKKALAIASARKRQAEAQGAGQPAPATVSQVPEGMFLDPRTGAMTSRELLRNNVTTGPVGAFGDGYIQGTTLGLMDEAAGLVGQLEGGPDMANLRREQARARFEAQQEAHPVLNTTGKIAGAVTSPAVKAAPAVTTVKGAAAVGGSFAAAEAFGDAEGGFKERATEAAKAAPVGFVTSGLLSSIAKGGSKGLRAVFNRAEKRPSMRSLEAAKNAAYAQVRKAGVNFDGNDTQAAFQRLARKAKTARWDLDDVSEVDKPAFDALRVLERRANLGRPISLINLDKTRQKLWDTYNKTDHPFILEAISEIDEMIAQKASGNDLMLAARAANSVYAKAQLLDDAFEKARLQTAATGSGGNILNKYRQAVVSIVTNPKKAKWFSAEEVALMKHFVEGDVSENVLRRAGKLAPGGNGLMTALNVYAAAVDPSLLAVTAAATGAKAAADKSAMRGSERVLDAVSTGVIRKPSPAQSLRGVAVGSGIGANALNPLRN